MVFSGVVNWPNRELKQRRFWTAHVNRKWGLFHFNVPSCDATTFVLRLYFLLMNLFMNAKSLLLIGVRRSKKAFPEDSAFVNQHRFQATAKFKLQNHFFVTGTVVCYTAIFRVVTQRSSWGADYWDLGLTRSDPRLFPQDSTHPHKKLSLYDNENVRVLVFDIDWVFV